MVRDPASAGLFGRHKVIRSEKKITFSSNKLHHESELFFPFEHKVRPPHNTSVECATKYFGAVENLGHSKRAEDRNQISTAIAWRKTPPAKQGIYTR